MAGGSSIQDPAQKPRLRDSIIVQRDGSELLFIFTASRLIKRFAVSDLVMNLVPLLDGSRTVAQLVQQLGTGDGAAAEVAQALDVMRDEHILSRAADADSARILGVDRFAHYDRQVRLFQDICDEGMSDYDTGAELQRRLSGSTVLVCGIGGVGCWVVQALAATGVGTLRLCDGDAVEPSNLTRQVLFSAADAGRPKVLAAAARVRAVNPDVTVEPVERVIGGPGDLSDLVDGADLVVNCADQPNLIEVSGWVARACWPTVPHILTGGYAYHLGLLGTTVVPGTTACWECVRMETFADHGRDQAQTLVATRERSATTAALSGLVGNALAWEAVRVLAGLPLALTDAWTELDYWPMRVHSRAVPRRLDCPLCGTQQPREVAACGS